MHPQGQSNETPEFDEFADLQDRLEELIAEIENEQQAEYEAPQLENEGRPRAGTVFANTTDEYGNELPRQSFQKGEVTANSTNADGSPRPKPRGLMGEHRTPAVTPRANPKPIAAPSGIYNVPLAAQPQSYQPKTTFEDATFNDRNEKQRGEFAIPDGFKASGTFVMRQNNSELVFKPNAAQGDQLLRFNGEDAQRIDASGRGLIQKSLTYGQQGGEVDLSYDKAKGWSVEPHQHQQQKRK